MVGDVKDEIPRAEPAITIVVKNKGRPRCECRRAVIRALRCGALATRRFGIASALVMCDRENEVGLVRHPTRRPTRITIGAIVQCKDMLLPNRIHTQPRDRDYSHSSIPSHAQPGEA